MTRSGGLLWASRFINQRRIVSGALGLLELQPEDFEAYVEDLVVVGVGFWVLALLVVVVRLHMTRAC